VLFKKKIESEPIWRRRSGREKDSCEGDPQRVKLNSLCGERGSGGGGKSKLGLLLWGGFGPKKMGAEVINTREF